MAKSEKFNYFVIQKEKRIFVKLNFFLQRTETKGNERLKKSNGKWMNFSFHLAISSSKLFIGFELQDVCLAFASKRSELKVLQRISFDETKINL